MAQQAQRSPAGGAGGRVPGAVGCPLCGGLGIVDQRHAIHAVRALALAHLAESARTRSAELRDRAAAMCAGAREARREANRMRSDCATSRAARCPSTGGA
jgi:sRNA-binding protein